jgi:hypothetical protein
MIDDEKRMDQDEEELTEYGLDDEEFEEMGEQEEDY